MAGWARVPALQVRLFSQACTASSSYNLPRIGQVRSVILSIPSA